MEDRRHGEPERLVEVQSLRLRMAHPPLTPVRRIRLPSLRPTPQALSARRSPRPPHGTGRRKPPAISWVVRGPVTGTRVSPFRQSRKAGRVVCRKPGSGLVQALAACRAGDELVVTKLDRLARSLLDARAISEELTGRQVKLNLGGAVHDPTDPVGRLLFNMLAMVAEFEADLIRARTREGMRVAKAKGRLRGKQPKLSPKQEAHLVKLYRAGEHTIGELEELFGITRSTVYRAIRRGERQTPAV